MTSAIAAFCAGIKLGPKLFKGFQIVTSALLTKKSYLVCPTMLHHSSLDLSGFCECWCLLIRRHGCRCCTCCAGSGTLATVGGQQLNPSEARTRLAKLLMLFVDGGENTRHCKSDQTLQHNLRPKSPNPSRCEKAAVVVLRYVRYV